MRSNYELHAHSNKSDGDFSPQKLLKKAKKSGLKALAITDHGTLEGAQKISKMGTGDLTFIPGIEFTAGAVNEMIHILAYFKKIPEMEFEFYSNPEFLKEKQLINTSLNYLKLNPKIWSSDIEQITNILKLIEEKQGISVLAHPSETNLTPYKLDKFVKTLVGKGLDGIEIYNGKRPDQKTDVYRKIAEKYDLLKTSGTDFHSQEKELGQNKMTDEMWDRFKQELNI